MSENKYVRMMRQQQQRCHRQALDWPRHSVTREGWEREVVEWQAAADVFEALLQVCEWQLVPPHPVGSNAEYRRLSEEWAKAALKKAKGEV